MSFGISSTILYGFLILSDRFEKNKLEEYAVCCALSKSMSVDWT